MLVHALIEARRRRPNALAVQDASQALSYRQLTTLATLLRDVALRETRCPRIGIMLPSGGPFAATLFGTLWAPRVAVPLNFLLSPAELEQIVADAKLDLILSIRYFRKITGQLSTRTICLEDLPLRRRALWASFRPLPPPPQADPHDVAVLLYTSGTSGPCKGVQLTHGNLMSNCDGIIEAAGIADHDRFLALVPPFHVLGLTANVLVPVRRALSVYAVPRFTTGAVLEAIEQFAPTIMVAIPTMYGALLRASATRSQAYRPLRLMVSGGEPLPERIAGGFKERFGVDLLEGYGLTETSPVVSLNTPAAFRPGSVGKVLPHTQVRLVTDEGEDAATRREGEIWVRGPGVMAGYYHRPEETAEVLDGQGWFRTGDIGTLDADGFLSITGRKKEMIIVGGENVFPREIERALEQHPAVDEAAVVGTSDPSRGEVPLAFVTLKSGAAATEIELRSFARGHLAGYKVPREVRILDEFPRGPTGKVAKKQLRERVEAAS